MNTPPEGSLIPRPKLPVLISRALITATDAAPTSVQLNVTWPATTALMPVLAAHILVPMPLFGAN